MKKLLIIEADTNDSDYVTKCDFICEDEEDTIRKVVAVLKNNNKSHNWANSEYAKDKERPENKYKDQLTEDDICIFNDHVPYGEYGIHTIESIKLMEIASEEELF